MSDTGTCPRCGLFSALHKVETPLSTVKVCEECAKERNQAVFKARNKRAIKRGGCLRCSKPSPKYVNGFCTICAVDVIIDHEDG